MQDFDTQFGPYEISDELGRSPLYTVYLAYERSQDRHVALKIPTERIRGVAELRAQFLRAGRQAQSLDHPHIVPVYDVGEIDEYPYIASSYIPGVTLRRWLAGQEGPLQPEESIRLVRQIGAALDYANQRGIIHGAVHPDNVIVTDDGNAVVTDFGLAAVNIAATGNQPQESVHPADLAFIAPEQCQQGTTWHASTDV
ncbi:MAG: serine/threonine protein kinase, partial [Caldilineaceae bacterium]|nr:serine/threonine protein kinase [Caldilineaceae bacterium]